MNGFLEALEIRPGAGSVAAVLGLFAVVAALAGIGAAELPMPGKFVAALVTAIAAGLELRLHVGARARRRITRAVLAADGQWQVFPADGPQVRGHLSRHWGASVGPVIALEWQCEDGRCRQAWLVRPQLPADTWRRLRVRLRFA